jgi:hypothetical protein
MNKEQVLNFYGSLTYEEKHTYAPLYIMKVRMIEEIESQLRDLCSDENEKSRIAIADINFVLDNSWLFDLLKQRGDAIKWKNWPALKAVN